ncbi:MAG: hypothetical protein ACOY4K_13560 [Pseudomonadota bacterium]
MSAHKTAPRPAEASFAVRRRPWGKVDSTRWAEVIRTDFGLLQVGKVSVKSEVTYAELEQISREEQQRAVDTYFTTPLGIFSSYQTSTAPRGWREHVFDFLYLWPEPLEKRLIVHDTKRFGRTDEDIRSLVDTSVSVFEHNVFRYMVLKRTLQAFALAAVLAVSAAAIAWPEAKDSASGYNWPLLASAAGLPALWVIVRLYVAANTMLYDQYYRHAVKYTVDHVSRPIRERMMSIRNCIEEYASHIDRLLGGGEEMHNAARARDRELKDGHAFLRTQMLLWLPVRTLGIEWSIRNRMETAEKNHAIFAGVGFLLAGLILLGFLAAQGAVLALLLQNKAQASDGMAFLRAVSDPVFAMRLVLAVLAIAATVYVSFLSYYKTAWNPAKHLLEEYFDTTEWMTFSKLEMDVRLAARVQRAMIEIEELNRKIGPHRH